MEDKPKRNTIGSKVQHGYQCKPVNLDPNKPLMYYETHFFVCTGERCMNIYKEDDFPLKLRELIKELNLAKGRHRIKVTRTGCFGACRHKAVSVIYCRAEGAEELKNNGIWLKQLHSYNNDELKEILLTISENKPLKELLSEDKVIKLSLKD